MKKHTLGLSIATILLLAACGGGGSDDNSPADPNNGGSNNNTPSVPKTNTPSTPKPNTPSAPNNPVSGKYQGTAYIVPVGSQPEKPLPGGSASCSGTLNYKGNTYLFRDGMPCPIPDNVFRRLTPAASSH